MAEDLMQTNIVSQLGTLQLMVGLFNIGLGPGRVHLHYEDFVYWGTAYWLGGVLIISGIVALLANTYPCPFSVGFSVLLNIIGFVVSAIGIYLYSVDIPDISQFVITVCGEDNRYCSLMGEYYTRMMTGVDVTMIVLSAVTLLACITAVGLGFRNLFIMWKKKEEARDDEMNQPEKEALLTSPGA